MGVGTYAGQAALPYVASAVLSADTIANGYVSVLENVYSKAVLRKFSGTAIQANDDCAFTSPDSGQLTLGEAVLEAIALKVNEQVCNADLRATWESQQIRSQNAGAPADFTTFVAQYVASKVAENVEINLWGGNFDPTDSSLTGGGVLGTSFDGLFHHIVDDEADLGYDGNATDAFTADAGTNGILTWLDALVSNAPSAVQSDGNANIYMSRKSLFLLQRAMAGLGVFQETGTGGHVLAGAGYSPEFVGQARPTSFLGFNVIAPAGCPNDTLLLSNPNQLYFGTNILTDHIQASILDLTGVTGDDVTRVIMQFSGGTQIVDAGSLSVVRRTS